MEFSGLRTQYERLRPQMEKSVLEVLSQGSYIMGPQVEELEGQLAQMAGVPECVSVSSGTDALLMALMASGIGPGDGVITTAFSFFATAEVILLCQAVPIFCDCNPDTYNLDPFCLEQTIKKHLSSHSPIRLKAVIPVDLFGLCADYTRICEICQDYGLMIIEDAAQSFGASLQSQKAGSFGRFGCTSFFPAKPLGCYGDGGAIFAHTQEDADLLRSLRVHGKGRDKYENRRVGLNARLDTIQAAVLLEKLKVFPDELKRRQQVAAQYTQRLEQIVKTPQQPEGYFCCFAQYTIGLESREQRDKLREFLTERRIPTNIYYPIPLNRQKAVGGSNWPMPNAETAADRVLSLPMHPYLEPKEIDQVCDSIFEYIQGYSQPQE